MWPPSASTMRRAGLVGVGLYLAAWFTQEFSRFSALAEPDEFSLGTVAFGASISGRPLKEVLNLYRKAQDKVSGEDASRHGQRKNAAATPASTGTRTPVV